jgi:hypothetical protein
MAKKWIIVAEKWKIQFSDDKWAYREGDNWLEFTSKDGKTKISVPRESIYYIIETTGE